MGIRERSGQGGPRLGVGGGLAGASERKLCLPCSLTAPRSARSVSVAQSIAELRSSTVTGALFTLATIFTPVILREAAQWGGGGWSAELQSPFCPCNALPPLQAGQQDPLPTSNSRVVLNVVKAVMLQVLLASALSMKKRVTSSLAVVSAGTEPSGKEPLKLEAKAVSSDGRGYGMSGVSSALLATTPPSEKVST